MRAIADRFDTYRLNVGGARVVWNLLIVGLLVYILVSIGSTTAKAVFAGLILCGATLGTAIIPIAPRNPRLASRLVSAAWWIAIIFMALNFTRLNPAPLLGSVGIFFFAMAGLSGSFWLNSTPGLLTAGGSKRLERRIEHRENLRRIADGEGIDTSLDRQPTPGA